MALCYACRVYAPNLNKKDTFTHTGFSNWNMATTKDKGFQKHAKSSSHECAMKAWEEHSKRISEGSNIEIMVLKRIPEHRVWVHAVFNVVKYLAFNGLPFRGDGEHTDFVSGNVGGGLYLNTFSELLFQINPELERISKRLPDNAKYSSPDIQNEVIHVIGKLLKRNISSEVKAAQIFTIMADGSTDQNGIEIEGFAVRYIDMANMKVKEHDFDVLPATDRSASGLLELLVESAKGEDVGIDLEGGVVSQTYDGANVMSGKNAGLQALLSDYVRRLVIDIHCYCHKLALVVKDSLTSIPFINEHYCIVSSLYNHFKLANISNFYDGNSLKRLIETRRSGHLSSIKAIDIEIVNVINCLHATSTERSVKVEHRAISFGLYHQLCNPEFILFNKILKEILEILNIASQIFQSKSSNISANISVINECRREIEDVINIYEEVKISNDLAILSTRYTHDSARPTRNRNMSANMLDYIVEDANISSDTSSVDTSSSQHLRQVIVELKDVLMNEFDNRFASKNIDLWTSMEALHPKSEKILDTTLLMPLYEYSNTVPVICNYMTQEKVDSEVLRSQCNIHKGLILRKFNYTDTIDLLDILQFLNSDYSSTAFVLIMLYKVAITCGYGSARVECLFSAMSHVDTLKRRNQSPYRECNLTHIYFERDIVKSITFEDFENEWCKKQRKLFF